MSSSSRRPTDVVSYLARLQTQDTKQYPLAGYDLTNVSNHQDANVLALLSHVVR